MMIHVDAVYENGVLHPKSPIELADGSEVRIAIHTDSDLIDPLAEVIGIGDGPVEGDVAQRHDEYLYGKENC